MKTNNLNCFLRYSNRNNTLPCPSGMITKCKQHFHATKMLHSNGAVQCGTASEANASIFSCGRSGGQTVENLEFSSIE